MNRISALQGFLKLLQVASWDTRGSDIQVGFPEKFFGDKRRLGNLRYRVTCWWLNCRTSCDWQFIPLLFFLQNLMHPRLLAGFLPWTISVGILACFACVKKEIIICIYTINIHNITCFASTWRRSLLMECFSLHLFNKAGKRLLLGIKYITLSDQKTAHLLFMEEITGYHHLGYTKPYK